MSDSDDYHIDPPMTRSKTPLPMNFWQNVSDPPVVNNRKAPPINRPAPASMKRKMEQAAHVKDLLKQCKSVSINLERLSQQEITRLTKKHEHHHEQQQQHNHVRKTKKLDRNRWQRGYVDKRKKPKIEKSSDGNKSQNSPEMRPTHIWGCCRMIPFDRNRLRNQKRFAITNSKEFNKEIAKHEISNESPSTSKVMTKNTESEKQLNSENEQVTMKNEQVTMKNEEVTMKNEEVAMKNEEETCVCRRTIPYNRKSCYKTMLNLQNDSGTQAGGSKNSRTKVGPKISKTQDYHLIRKKSDSSPPTKKTEANETRKSDDSTEEGSSWFNNRSMWKVKRKHRSRRISSSDETSTEDEKPRKKRRISTSDDSISNELPRKKKKIIRSKSKTRTSSHNNLELNQSSILNYLYKKPKTPMKEARIILTRLENMLNNPYAIRWRNRGIKVEKIEDDPVDQEEEEEEEEEHEETENFQNEKYYLLHEDGTMSSEPIPQEALLQFGNYPQDFIRINTFNGEMLNVAKYLNNLQENQDYPVENRNQDHNQKQISYNIENYPKVLLIRLETLVGALDLDYSASEIEILEEKYIDFLLNSNFSYDKQSQSFFNVYKRLQVKRQRERHNEILNAFTEQINTTDNDIDEDDKIALAMDRNDDDDDDDDEDDDEEEENPLVIALENEREDLSTIVEDWASDESNSAHDNADQSNPTRYSVEAPSSRDSIEFVPCDPYTEAEIIKDPQFISCKFCKTTFPTYHSFSLHKASCHSKNKKPLKCEHCGNQYKCRKNLNLHIQLIHDQNDKPKSKTANKNRSSSSVKSNVSAKKKALPQARNNLRCGVCSITLETKESLFDHIYQHTERELQEAFHDATIRKRDEEIRKEQKVASENEWANKYAQWKDKIFCKNNSTEESMSLQNEEITVCSSTSEELRRNENENATSVITHTNASEKEETVVQKITMCPCHSNDTSTLVNDDMQIEMVLLCEICQVLFRRLECFEVHYRVNRLCNRDRSSRLPKLFCSSCKILLNSLPEMRRHLEKHALVNRQGHVTFLCNICKVMFFGIGSLFYSHWFNHNKDVNFLASRYSFPKLSIVPCMNLTDKVGNSNNKEEYLFVAEHVCRDCRIPFGSEIDLERHNCTSLVRSAPVVSSAVKVMCLVCNKMFPNKTEYFLHELNVNHMRSTKPEYVTISTNAGQKAYICAQCKTVRKTTDEMKEHWTFHRAWREKFICSYCPKFFDSNIHIVEAHCKNCSKEMNSFCKVSFELATFKCQPCNLYFETSQEAKEHNLICLRSQFATTSESSNKQTASTVNSSLTPNSKTSAKKTKTSPSILRLTVPSSALSSVASKGKSVNNSESQPPTILDGLAAKLTDLPSSSKASNSLRSYFSQAVLDCTEEENVNSTSKSKTKNGLGSDVEVIDILSETSSKSSSSDKVRQPSNSVDVPKDMPLLTDKNKSVSKTSPGKKKTKTSDQSKEKKEQATLKVKKNLTMTAINPEFESLLTELEGMDMKQGKDSKRPKKATKKVSKETKGKQLTLKEILKDPLENNEELPSSDAGSVSSKSGKTSTLSGSKTTDSPLPFEMVLVPEEENPKTANATVEKSSSQVDINSNKSTQKAANSADPKDASDSNSSIIEEYIEYIMMDVMSDSSTSQAKETSTEKVTKPPEPPEETAPPVEKVAPTRLRVRSLAELQEIKMHHLCETCGQSFNAEKDFIEHTKKANCSKSKPSKQKSNYDIQYIPNQKTPMTVNFIPPLLPLGKNVSVPRSTVPPTLHQSRLNFPPQNEVNSAFSSNCHRSGANPIQLPERVGGNAPQKRPSGAATRIQNLSHPPRQQTITPAMIQHQGLPHSYTNRSAPVRMQIRPPPPPYNPGMSSAQLPYRPTDASTSLTCTTCFFTAKTLAEFSAHLLVHYMENTSNNAANPQLNPTDPNTSAYQNSQIIASDIYGTSSVGTPNSSRRIYQQPPSKYIYDCLLCSFKTDSKPVIREHEKHHLQAENLQQLQKQQMVHSTYQTHPQQQTIPQNVTMVQSINQTAIPIASKPTKDTDKGPVLLYSSVSNTVFQCLLCNSFFFSVHEDFAKHLQTVHKQSHKENIQQNPTESVCYVCDYCDPPQVFNTEINLRKHMEFLHNHSCHICGQRCTSREILQNHVISHKMDGQAQ
ncbi:uncharacterized protein LOC122509127 [Leptopilina heterotoma]|uniref:uncharacterized protein LOC122509127 n=1 Tax=Leptopilina heterotoma TaxID=63436 RepID=UPI001CA9C416|nr:uncharacterized protein LOC122509127 [Leptopilina heterotoma]